MIPPEVKKLTSIIHILTCVGNHTDYCAYFGGEEHREDLYRGAATVKTSLPLDELHDFAIQIRPNRKKWDEVIWGKVKE